MKDTTKTKIKNLTIDVLDFFLNLPEAFVKNFDRKEFYRLLNGHYREQSISCSKIARILSDLKKRGYVTVDTSSAQESIKFTSKAKLAVIESLVEKNTPDNKFRFVSFDIPELIKINRNRFRRAIKRMGFRQIQKSLWVCDRNVGDLVETASREYMVEQYIVYIVSDITNIDDSIEKLLKGN